MCRPACAGLDISADASGAFTVVVELPFAVRGAGAVPGGRTVFVTAEQSYASTPPNLWDWRCRYPRRSRRCFEMFARGDVQCPPETIIEFADAAVIDGKYVLSRDRIGVGESFADVWLDEALVARMAPALAAIDRRDVTRIADRGPPVLHIFKEGADNFGHVVVEMLPKLVHAAAIGLKHCRVLLPAQGEKLRGLAAYAGAVLGMQLEFIPCPPGSVVLVERLLWCGPVAKHGARKSRTLLALADRLLADAPRADGPSRLYVTRPAGAIRPIIDNAELENLARARGYAVVEPGRLPFREQLSLFRGAQMLLGPLGAGLTNALAMAEGTKVGMIDPGLCDPFFWDLACLKQQQFTWIFTREITPFEPKRLTAPFAVDIAALGPALDWFESDPPPRPAPRSAAA